MLTWHKQEVWQYLPYTVTKKGKMHWPCGGIEMSHINALPKMNMEIVSDWLYVKM